MLRSGGIAYGPGSARGVINIITKKSKEETFGGNLSASYGSWNTHDENASVYGRVNQWDYLANIGKYSTDGYEEEDEDRLSVLAKLGYNLSDQSRIGLKYNFIEYDHGTVEGFSKKKWQLENYRRERHFPKSQTDADLIWHNEKEQENSTLALEFAHKDEKLFVNSVLSWTGYGAEFRRLKDLYDNPKAVYYENVDQDTYAFSLSGGYAFDFGAVSYTPSIGVNYEDIGCHVSRIKPYDLNANLDAYNFDLQKRQYGFFWDNNFLFGEKWGLKIGGRVDRAEVELEDRVPNKVDEDKVMYSYSVAPSYHFSDKANVYVSAGRNYWFPTPRYYAWAVEKGGTVNPPEDLKPEEATTYEIGYKHMLHKAFNINVTLYSAEYKDKFGAMYEGTTSRGQGNIGDAEAKGIELEADGRLCSFFGYRFTGAYQKIEWTSGTAYAYIHPTNTRDRQAALDGKQVYWVPEYSYMVGLDFFPVKGLKCSMDINHMGKRYVDYLNQIEYPAKTTVDAKASYSWKNWKIWILGKNIFDEKVEYISNSSGRLTAANGEPDNAYFIQDGAYFEAGVSYRF